MDSGTGDGAQSLSVHQLLGRLAPAYLERFGSSMPGRHRQVLKKILSCRTPALGGQLFQCPGCSGFEYRYHSCNDRHCPQCGQPDADAWLERQRERLLLPVRKEHPDLFAEVPPEVWAHPWNVGCQAAGSGENALRYLSRYIFKTATSNRKVQLLAEGKVLWTYRQSKTRQFTSIKLDPLDFMSRFLQHVLPRGFARVRTFGWLHPAAKVRANRVRALLRQKPVLTPAEEQTWEPPAAAAQPQTPKPEVSCTPFCSRCQQAMRLVGSWRAGQPLLYPKRPP
jgi:hypothetical protein